MRAIVINPEAQTVEEHEFDGSLPEIYRLTACTTFTTFGWRRHTAYCDDEGLYREPAEDGTLPMTLFEDYAQPIVGNVMLLGPPDREGDDTPCRLTVDEVRAQILFHAYAAAGTAGQDHLVVIHYHEIIDDDLVDRYGNATLDDLRRALDRLPVDGYMMTSRKARAVAMRLLDVGDQHYKDAIDNPAFRDIVFRVAGVDRVPPEYVDQNMVEIQQILSTEAHVLWHAYHYRRNRRMYHVTPALGQKLHHTHLTGVRSDDLRLPYRSIFIEVPVLDPPLEIYNDQSGQHRIVGVYVVECPEQPNRPRTWELMTIGETKGVTDQGAPDDALLYWDLALDRETVEECIEVARARQEKFAEASRMPMIWSSVFRWIMNVVLYATMPDARVQRDPVTTKHWQRMQKAKGTARKEAERRWRRLGHRMIVGQGVEALGDALKERVLVTGHYRHVVHGPRRSLRRRQWIEPYYKGPEDAPESRTQHRL